MLGEHLNISLNEMVAIGDSMEDLEIIENVGLGVAMGNSPVELKQAQIGLHVQIAKTV